MPPSSPLIFLRSQSLVYLNGILKPCRLLCHETYSRKTFAVWNQSSLLLRHLTSEENFFCSSQIFKHCSIADVIRFSWWRRAKRESGKICDFLFSHHLIANKRNGKVFIPFCWMDVLWMVPFPVRTLLFQENRKLFYVLTIEKNNCSMTKVFHNVIVICSCEAW